MDPKPLPDDDGKQSGIQVLARAAAIMRALGEMPAGMSLAGIAAHVGLPRSTVQRIVSALETENLVEPQGAGGGFRLGPALAQLVYRKQADIASTVRPYLQELSEQFQETTALASLVAGTTNVVDRVVAERLLRVAIPVGASAPLYATAAGRVLLAMLPNADLDDFLRRPLPALNGRTTSLVNLRKSISQIQNQQYAIEIDEFEVGVSSVAVPLCTYLGTFSLTFILPSSRLAGQMELMRNALHEARMRIESRIGI